MADTVDKQGVDPDQLTIHADRGSPMIAKPVAFLLADLGVAKSLQPAPHEQRQSVLGEPVPHHEVPTEFPDRFGCFEDAHASVAGSSAGTTTSTATRASGCTRPPTSTTDGPRPSVHTRGVVLDAAYATHPERFVRKVPSHRRYRRRRGSTIREEVIATAIK